MKPLFMKPLLSRLPLVTIVVGGLLTLAAQPLRAETREWSDSSGKFSIEAELVDVKDGKVLLKKADNSQIAVPVARLSGADRQYLQSLGHKLPGQDDVVADKVISALLEKVRQQTDMPAIAGAIVTSDGMAVMGVSGVRKRGTKTPATAGDVWHLGSDTKAMTATLVAQLVNEGKLKWDTTLGEVFQNGGAKIHPDLAGVTVLHLLTHRSGLTGDLNWAEYQGADSRKERVRVVSAALAEPPASPPGSKFEYSNLGYVVVAAIVEKVTGESWEENMARRVFGPLKMTSVGLGGLGTPGKVDQPWPHADDGKPVPGNGPLVDNPLVMGPAGRVHCTVADWSKYLADYLRGLNGKAALLPGAAYETLTTPPFGGDYAPGWIVTEREWAGGKVLTHSGSNTMNFCTVWLAPKRDFAALACTNQGGDAAAAACDAAVTVLIQYQAAKGGK